MITSTKFSPTWESLKQYEIPDWYIDGKFGIFIHWGVYAVPAFSNEWYPRNMYIQGSPEYEHHVKTYGPHTEFGYKDFIPLFRAEKFDPAAWAELFHEAGARFVVPVAEHHDGFAMYDCSTSLGHAAFPEYLKRFAAHYYNRGEAWGKGVAINYKYNAFEEGTAVLDIERGQLSDIRPQLWVNSAIFARSSGRTTRRSPRTPGVMSSRRITRAPNR